jgi:TonB family protein
LSPRHELAAQYVDLTQSKLQVAEDRLLLQWQKSFDARDYKAAAADYRQIMAMGDNGTSQAVGHVTREYRKALSPLVEAWNLKCSSGDSAGVAQIRGQVSELIPEPSFAEDVQAQMKTCKPAETSSAPKVARLDSKTEPVVAASSSCLQMESQLALTRLKTRVDPEIPPGGRAYLQNSQIIIKVKVKIDEGGNVAPLEVSGSNAMLNNAVRAAVEKWKFTPIADRNGPRCVNTEIPVVLGK